MGMMTRSLAELTREQARDRAPLAVALIPIGACEQHGPHLPIGTDSMLVEHLAQRAAEHLDGNPDVLVAPLIPFGFSLYHLPIGPTVTLRVDTVMNVLRDVIRSLAGSGFRKVFVLNGHGGNAEIVTVAGREVAIELGILVGSGSYWTMAWDDLIAAGAQTRGRLPGHAGAFESSMVKAIRPELLDDLPAGSGRFEPNPGYARPYHTEDPTAWQGQGFSDDPSAADADLGRQWLEVAYRSVAEGLRRFATGHRPTVDDHT